MRDPTKLDLWVSANKLVHRGCGGRLEKWLGVWECKGKGCGWEIESDVLEALDEHDLKFLIAVDGPPLWRPPDVLVEDQIGDKRFVRAVPQHEASKYDKWRPS